MHWGTTCSWGVGGMTCGAGLLQSLETGACHRKPVCKVSPPTRTESSSLELMVLPQALFRSGDPGVEKQALGRSLAQALVAPSTLVTVPAGGGHDTDPGHWLWAGYGSRCMRASCFLG